MGHDLNRLPTVDGEWVVPQNGSACAKTSKIDHSAHAEAYKLKQTCTKLAVVAERPLVRG
jgi:uncharacterized membrane protein